jgi:hypothetical protein
MSTQAKTTLEDVYNALAVAIDAVDPAKESLFLSKLALLLAHELNDPDRALGAIEQAQKHL